MRRSAYITIALAIILIIAGFLYWNERKDVIQAVDNFEECAEAGYPVLQTQPRQCVTPEGGVFTEEGDAVSQNGGSGNLDEKKEIIRVNNPKPNETITSPLTVTGEARGTWYFEASFPVKLLDANGKVLAQVGAEAQGDWMTENFVPFRAFLTFPPPTTSRGTLVLEKDNPSGLPQNADEVRIPVKFITETMTIKAHFSQTGQTDCSKTVAIQREIPKTEAVGRAALEELLEGPTEEEKGAGLFTSIPEGAKVQSLVVENGIARVDFSEILQFQVGGSCRVAAIRAQITSTLKQFPTVDKVIISINGRTEDILQP